MDDPVKILEKSHHFLLFLWWGLWALATISLLIIVFWFRHLFPEINFHQSPLHTIYFLMYATILFLIFFLKRHYLQADKLNRMLDNEEETPSQPIFPFFRPFAGEEKILGGVPFLVRQVYTMVYNLLLILLIGNMIFLFVTFDKRSFYLYATVSLFAIFLQYPARQIWNKLYWIIQEEKEVNHDPFQSMG